MRKTLILLAIVLSGCGSSNSKNESVAVVVNEFMTSNNNGLIIDEYGESEDWIELYNNSDVSVDLTEFYLSDDSTDLNKFELSGISIQSRGFMLIWADDDPDQGALHAPFKLSTQDGEEIIISNGNKIIDRIQFFPHNNNPEARIPNESYGRKNDGDAVWTRQAEPTPGASNHGIIVEN